MTRVPSKAVLREGLREGDLADMVLPLLSVDEYESKITPEAVVVGFYVRDQQAANDLNRFIQKSPAPLLDTDVSPAPDQHGYYLVFVEVLPDKKAGAHLDSLLREIAPLVSIQKWEMRVRHIKSLVSFSPKAFGQSIVRSRRKVVSERLQSFFAPSDLASLTVKDRKIRFGSGVIFEGELVSFGHRLALRSTIETLTPDFSLSSAAYGRKIEQMLGEGWRCDAYDDGTFALSRVSGDAILLLRKCLP